MILGYDMILSGNISFFIKTDAKTVQILMNCGHNVSCKLLEIIPADLSDSVLMSGRAIVV